jgi:hypothetical protein
MAREWTSAKRNSSKNLISLKFTGELLLLDSIPIYELGDSLVAIQRIVHKAYLFQHERLQKHAQLTQSERRLTALQITERRKSSDLYALAPFLSDPFVKQQISDLLKMGLEALEKYALKKVFSGEKDQKRNNPPVQIREIEGSPFIGAIYAETVQITNHINNIGGVESIELVPDAGLKIPPIKLTADTQKYVREVANEFYRGPSQQIVGTVKKLAPDRLTADVLIGPNQLIKVGLTEEAFQFVRYETNSEQRIRFKGHALYRLGNNSGSFREFQADSAQVEKKKDSSN